MFVGRRRELAALDAAFGDAERGSASTVLISADAGVGKSRLVAEFSDRARGRGATVLTGACLQIADGNLPFAAITEALRGLVRDVGADTLRRVAGGSVRTLGVLVPDLGGGRGAGAAPSRAATQDAQGQLFDALLNLLERLGGEHPTVVVLEDIHWADRSTRELLLFLTHNLRDARVLVVATHRRAELEPGHPLRPALAELSRHERVRRLELAAFDREEIAAQLEAILAAPPSRDLVDRVFARSQGNAFFIEELVASGATERDSELPESLREMLLTSLDTLPSSTRQVLRAAAAAGRRVHHELLARVVPGELDLDDALRHAVNRRILVPDTGSGSYAFRHALFAEAIRSALLPGERERLHRRLAEVLEAEPSLASEAPAAELAVHWQAVRDPVRTLQASFEAAREADALHATVEAREHVERVLATWDQVPGAADLVGLGRSEVVAWLAELAHRSGDADRGRVLLEQLLADSSDGVAPETRGLWWLTLGHCREALGDETGAVQAWDQADAIVPVAPPSAARAAVLATRAAWDWERDPSAAAQVGAEAVEMARAVGDPIAEAAALLSLGSALGFLGRLDEAMGHFEAARDLALEHDPVGVARTHVRMAAVLIRGGRASEGGDVAIEGLERARALGIERAYGPWLAGNAASGLFWAGRWDEAAGVLGPYSLGGPVSAFHVVAEARLLAHRGDTHGARALLDAAQGSTQREPRLASLLLALATFEGDLEEAHRIVLSRHEFAAPAHAATVNELRAWALRVEADRGAPDPDLCDALLAETTMERSGGAAHAEPWRLMAVAEHERAVGRNDPARWEEAVSGWEALAWPYPIASARFRLAEALLAADGDQERIADLLLACEEVSRELGAAPLRHDVRTLARRAGVDLGLAEPSRDRNGDRPYGLTAREAEVLALVAEGRSNRDIGEQLYISQKTASVHVSNILRKLEVSGRTQAAAIAIREGLAPSEVASSRD